MGFVRVVVCVFLACLNCVSSLASPSQFASLSRVELQALAKQNGIKANIASDKIIALLEAAPAATTTKAKPAAAKAKPATTPAAVAKAPAAVTKAKPAAAPAASKSQPKTEKQGGSRLKAELASTKPDVARVLDEQGLRISDLLELRKSLEVKQQELDKRPSKTVEKKAAPASSGAGSKKKPANISLKPKPPAVAAASSGEEVRVVKAPAPAPAPAPKAAAAPVFEGWTPNFAVSTPTFSGESSFKAISSFKSSTSSSSGGVAAPAASRASLDGVTLEDMLSALIKAIGFEGLFEATKIRAFYSKPSLTSSLKALRAPDMAWGREKVEALYKAKIVARK